MIYSVNKTLHADFSVFSKHKLSPRAYAIPYTEKTTLEKTGIKAERYSSDMVKLLSGEWDFKFYRSIADLPDRLDTLKTKFTKINVPSDWQRTGFQEPVYLNCPYEFKTMAPHLPDDMPVGVYRKFFDVENPEKVYIISFLGVSNNMALYVNGKFAGYSEGSHNTAEFDITHLLTAGVNELVLVSFKWCNGSFLEAQDMFRENGIFRDVLLYVYPQTYLYDFELQYKKCEGGYDTQVQTTVKGKSEYAVTVCLKDENGNTIAEAQADDKGKADFDVISVKEWNAEEPAVYFLYITLQSENGEMTLRSVAGFKTIAIENGVFYWNGAPIKLKGVNHHDTDLYKGYAMSLDDMERDVLTMKGLNVNAVRTSHYPPDPFFLTLADVYGLYIVDEADIETHGCWEMADDINILSHDLKWAAHYVDRVKRMYFRDRNHPCVIMWSLGNESGGYRCHDKCYRFLKSTGTQIPVHYEGVVRTRRFHYDVISEMYTNTYDIEAMMRGSRKRSIDDREPAKVCREYSKYPFYLCEYCHAMGVGPGNMEEYWDLIYEWDNAMGGCVWEWADHTVYHPDGDKKYKYRYTYGGDHGEKQHDGHFCVDGLMYADRTPHTGAKEMKVVYRPLRASHAGEKLYCIENTNRFRDSSYIGIKWVLLENGAEVESGTLKTAIPPMGAECVKIAHKDIDLARDAHINFIYTDLTDGREIAVEQLTLNDTDYAYDIEVGSKIAAEVENGVVTVKFENGECVFSGVTGDLTSYKVNGTELLAEKNAETAGFVPNLYRALIDNDARMRDKWREGGLDGLKKTLKSFDAHINDGEIEIVSVFTLKAKRKEFYEVSIAYTVSSLGAIEVNARLKVTNETAVTDIPRFGLTIELNRAFEDVKYYGRGTAENMPDFKAQSPVGIYSDKVDDMFERYVYPQESGMHCDVKWIELSGSGIGLKIYADASLAFSVHHFTQNAINKAQHQEDLKDMDITFLTLDGFVRGIGSSSCGPDTRNEYKGDANEGYEVSFTLIPNV